MCWSPRSTTSSRRSTAATAKSGPSEYGTASRSSFVDVRDTYGTISAPARGALPDSDGDAITVDIEPIVDDGELSRHLRLTVPMGITSGEILTALRSFGLDPATPALRAEQLDDFPRRTVLVFRPP